MKIIFATVHLEPSTRAIPLAAACLKALIKGHDVQLANLYMDQSSDEIAESLKQENPDIIGFPVYLWNRELVIASAQKMKSQNPGLIILAGGPEVTAAPESFLSDSGVDYAMQGEGEEVIASLIDALAKGENPENLPGVWSARSNPERAAYCRDFNALPSPILSESLDLSQNSGLLWELSRGCPFACDFCFESKGSKVVRTLDPERIRQELQIIGESGIEQVFVLDPTFNVNKKRVLEILSLIGEFAPETYFYFEIRSEFLDDETVAAFSEIPCTLQIGLQSSNPETLKLVNRKLETRAFREKMALLSEYQISFGLDLIYGLPGDSLESYRNSLDYALSLEPNHLDLFPLSVLPGTVLYDQAESLGLHALPRDPYRVTGSETFSGDDLRKAASLSALADQLYNQGKGISWFNSVCRDLNLSGADLVEKWGAFRKQVAEESLFPGRIQAFLDEIYTDREAFRVRRDLLNYLEVLEILENLEETAITPSEGVNLTEDSQICLYEGVLIRDFALEPALIPQSVYADLDEVFPFLEKESASWIFWTREWEMCFEKLLPETADILKALETMRSISELKKEFPQRETLMDFLTEGILEGYLQEF